MKRYFLGMASRYSTAEVWRHTFAWGRKKDCRELKQYLRKRYLGDIDHDSSRVILCKNGRSALALTLKAYFEPGDAVVVNGFTCYAVYEAIKAAGLIPIWTDISTNDLNFDADTLKNVDSPEIKGIIIQNSLGNPVDIVAVEKFAKKRGLIIIEDLAHSAGVKYPDGREAGTVGAGVAFSFGKDKSIDTVSGGAAVLRAPCKNQIKAPSKSPKISDHLRARFYPVWGALCRGLTGVHLGGALMRCLVKIHWVEKSADSKLDPARKISKFQAKLALLQFKKLSKTGELPLRKFYLVDNRTEVLKKLQNAGYYFGGFWYEKPVSPERYYGKVHFPEAKCPMATKVSAQIINFPTHYDKDDLSRAERIIKQYLINNTASTKRTAK